MCASQNDGFVKPIKTCVAMQNNRQKLVLMFKRCISSNIALLKAPNCIKSKDCKFNVNMAFILWDIVSNFQHTSFKWLYFCQKSFSILLINALSVAYDCCYLDKYVYYWIRCWIKNLHYVRHGSINGKFHRIFFLSKWHF